MPPEKTTIQEAVNRVKTWISNGEFEKALQGINEILEFDPMNEEVKKLQNELPTPSAAPTTTVPATFSATPTATPTTIERIHRKISPIAIATVIFVLLASGGIGYFASKYLKDDAQIKGSAITPVVQDETVVVAEEAAADETTTQTIPTETTPSAAEITPPRSTFEFLMDAFTQPEPEKTTGEIRERVKRR